MRTCDFLVENIGPSIPNFSTLTEMTKCQRETRNERSNPNKVGLLRHTSIKRERLTNHAQLKFTPARVQRDSAPSPHQRPSPSRRSYSCAPSPAKQTAHQSFACGLHRPVRKLRDNFPSGGGGRRRRRKRSQKLQSAHYLTKLSRSMDFNSWCADLISLA